MLSLIDQNMALRLTEKNVIMYAMKYYDNPQCVEIEEFYDDIKRINYIRRLFVRYKTDGELKERLILNHLIILFNVFPIEVANNLLFFKIESDHWTALKTFLVYLNYMPDKLTFVENCEILTTDIPLDSHIVSILRTI
jgi:hypothetical protein